MVNVYYEFIRLLI